VLRTLTEHALSPAQQALLRPAASLGQRETLREELARSLKHERLGLPLPMGSRLLRDRSEPSLAQQEEEEEEEETRTGAVRHGQLPARAEVEAEDAPLVAAEEQPVDPLAALAARALGTRARKPDRQSLKRHKMDAAEAAITEETESAAAAALAARALHSSDLRPLARALRADVTGEVEGVGDDPHAEQRLLARSAPPPSAGAFRPRKLVVHPPRPPAVQAARLKLPILAMEQEIMEAVTANPVTVLCGETGCGKTTQVPQFLFEAGFGHPESTEHPGAVCVTQPRRVAVTSTAARVASELGERLGGAAVGYCVRHDAHEQARCALRFVTDGVLLREAQSDLLLSRYSAVVVDEAHERSVNTDILLGLLSRIVPLRQRLAEQQAGQAGGVKPLKLIVMSATLRVEDFAANARLISPPPPVLRVPARQFPVTLHFARRTPPAGQHTEAAFRKVSAIHSKLPPGGILVFLTGQREVEQLCARLRRAFAAAAVAAGDGPEGAAEAASGGEAPGDGLAGDAYDRDALDAAADEEDAAAAGPPGGAATDSDYDEDDYDSDSSQHGDEPHTQQLGGDVGPEELAAAAAAEVAEGAALAASRLAAGGDAGPGPLHVLPLYAMLSPACQARVFRGAPEGHRLVVVATNVAETSLTLPGIRYVVDTGRAKARVFATPGSGGGGGGLSRFAVSWISQAAAAQRAGRAGRTGPGHCYRLYSSPHYVHELPPHEPPDILNVPLEGVVLTMKAMGVDNVSNFPFPSPPERAQLQQAQQALTRLGALALSECAAGGSLTELGAAMALLPIAPRAARFLLAAAASPRPEHVLPYAAAVAASLSLESPFVRGSTARGEDGEDGPSPTEAPPAAAPEGGYHAAFAHPRSDALSAAIALLCFEAAEAGAAGGGDALCARHSLHPRTLREAAELRRQLARLLARHVASICAPRAAAAVAGQLALPGAPPAQPLRCDGALDVALRRALLCGWCDRVAKRVKPADAMGTAPAGRAVRYRAAFETASFVFLHPSSPMRQGAPEWLCYTELLATGARPYLLGGTQVDPSWLAQASPVLVALSPQPLPAPAAAYCAAQDAVLAWHSASYGPPAWPLPHVQVASTHGDVATAAFAVALLDGSVVAPMGDLQDRLAAPAATAGKQEAMGQRRVGELLHALKARRVSSRAALAAAWRVDARFLLPQMSEWLRAGQAHVLERAWPRILAAVLADPAPRKTAKRRKE